MVGKLHLNYRLDRILTTTCTLVFVGLASSACGNLYIHSGQMETLAKDAKSGFEGVVAKNQVGALVDQIEADQNFAIDLVRSLGQTSTDTQLNAFLDASWDELIEQVREQRRAAASSERKAFAALEDIKDRIPKAVEELTNATKGATTAENALAQGRCYEERHIATQQLFASIVAINFDRNGPNDISAVTETLGKKVTPFDDQDKSECKGSGTVAELLKLESALAIVRLFATEDRDKAVAALFESVQSLPKLDPESGLALRDPGLSTTLLGLGYDLARAAELRLKAELKYWKNARSLREQQLAFSKEWSARLDQDLQGGTFSLNQLVTDLKSTNSEVGSQKIGDTLRSLGDAYKIARDTYLGGRGDTREAAEVSLRDARERMRYALIVIARSFENLYVLSLRNDEFENIAAVMETARAAAQSEAYLKEREAVIGRGLEGLAAFHQGGISSEDVQGLIGLAQFAALVFIAGGV